MQRRPRWTKGDLEVFLSMCIMLIYVCSDYHTDDSTRQEIMNLMKHNKVCVYVCIYACMYVYMYASMYVCIYVCMYVCIYVCMYVSHLTLSFQVSIEEAIAQIKSSKCNNYFMTLDHHSDVISFNSHGHSWEKRNARAASWWIETGVVIRYNSSLCTFQFDSPVIKRRDSLFCRDGRLECSYCHINVLSFCIQNAHILFKDHYCRLS